MPPKNAIPQKAGRLSVYGNTHLKTGEVREIVFWKTGDSNNSTMIGQRYLNSGSQTLTHQGFYFEPVGCQLTLTHYEYEPMGGKWEAVNIITTFNTVKMVYTCSFRLEVWSNSDILLFVWSKDLIGD